MKRWAKGRKKGIKAVRMDEPIYEIAQKDADFTCLSVKEFVSKCVLCMHKSIVEHSTEIADETFYKEAEKLLKEKDSFWKSLSDK